MAIEQLPNRRKVTLFVNGAGLAFITDEANVVPIMKLIFEATEKSDILDITEYTPAEMRKPDEELKIRKVDVNAISVTKGDSLQKPRIFTPQMGGRGRPQMPQA